MKRGGNGVSTVEYGEEWKNEAVFAAYSNGEPAMAWMAGIIDGEGCIRVHESWSKGRVTGYSLILTVEMTHMDTTWKLRNLFYTDKVRWCRARNAKCQPTERVTWTGEAAATVLWAVLPYLVTKKRQAEVGLRFQSYYPTAAPEKKFPFGSICHRWIAEEKTIGVGNCLVESSFRKNYKPMKTRIDIHKELCGEDRPRDYHSVSTGRRREEVDATGRCDPSGNTVLLRGW